MTFPTKDTFTFDHTEQADYPAWPPLQTKTNMNARDEELRLALNAVVNLLNAVTDGASGADSIGATAISTSPATVQGILEWLHDQILAIVAGGIADGSVTIPKLSFDPATQTELNTAVSTLNSAIALLIPLTQKGAANGIAPLGADTKVPLTYMSSTFVTGTYTGNGAASQDIALGFQPSAVYVTNQKAQQYNYSGLAITGINYMVGTLNAISVIATGFRVYEDETDGSYWGRVFMNNSGQSYSYIAFK
jgi:hypothetical protein